jgi:hypothetical protein
MTTCHLVVNSKLKYRDYITKNELIYTIISITLFGKKVIYELNPDMPFYNFTNSKGKVISQARGKISIEEKQLNDLIRRKIFEIL